MHSMSMEKKILKGDWEIKKYLLPDEYKYEKFLFKSDFICLLKNLDL